MSEIRIQDEWLDTRYGFPIRLFNVPMVKVRGVWTPKIDYAKLTLRVLRELVEKASPLTGHELRFIRQSLEMTQTAFAERFSVTHPAVVKWEQKGEQPTRMSWSTEKDIRLAVCEHASATEFQALYRQLQTRPDATPATELRITLDQPQATSV
ncbi:MAG: hypothetical protein CVV27_02365 [Candidatus Melainabacteria bacterium HGW-Melainabacteria-1]|nr:MAG: hypothetical protein CVV27_02365 [Candidatus Melainabacteria bacterium HGW-Melainabacteria-1]